MYSLLRTSWPSVCTILAFSAPSGRVLSCMSSSVASREILGQSLAASDLLLYSICFWEVTVKPFMVIACSSQEAPKPILFWKLNLRIAWTSVGSSTSPVMQIILGEARISSRWTFHLSSISLRPTARVLLSLRVLGAPPISLTVTSALVARMCSDPMSFAMLLSSISSCMAFIGEREAMCLMRGVFLILVAATNLISISMALVVDAAGLWTTVYLWNLTLGWPFILRAVSEPWKITARMVFLSETSHSVTALIFRSRPRRSPKAISKAFLGDWLLITLVAGDRAMGIRSTKRLGFRVVKGLTWKCMMSTAVI